MFEDETRPLSLSNSDDPRNLNYLEKLRRANFVPEDTLASQINFDVSDTDSIKEAAKQQEELKQTADKMYNEGLLNKKFSDFAIREEVQQQLDSDQMLRSFKLAALLDLSKHPGVLDYLAQKDANLKQARTNRLNGLQAEINDMKLFNQQGEKVKSEKKAERDKLYLSRNDLQGGTDKKGKNVSKSQVMGYVTKLIDQGETFGSASMLAEDYYGFEIFKDRNKFQLYSSRDAFGKEIPFQIALGEHPSAQRIPESGGILLERLPKGKKATITPSKFSGFATARARARAKLGK